jgi:hypothetical protein
LKVGKFFFVFFIMPGAYYNDNGSSFDDQSGAGRSFDSNVSAHDDSDPDRSADYSEDISNNHQGNGSNSSTDEGKRIANIENKYVLCSKFTVYIFLFLSAVGAGVGAFYLTRDQEEDDFENDVS